MTQPDATARLDAAVERANAPVAADPNDVGDADVPVPIAADSVRRETYVPAATVAAGTAAGAATLAPEPDAVPAAFAAPQTIYVQAPTPPKARGNRGFGVLVALIGTVAFAALYAGISYLLLLGQGDAVQANSVFTQFVARPVFWVPIVATFVGFALLAVIVNRGPWWYYAVFGLLVGVLVYFSYIGAALLTVEAWTLTVEQGNEFLRQRWLDPFAITACGRGARDPDLVRRLDRGAWPHGRRAQPPRTRGLRPRARRRPAAAARLSTVSRRPRGWRPGGPLRCCVGDGDSSPSTVRARSDWVKAGPFRPEERCERHDGRRRRADPRSRRRRTARSRVRPARSAWCRRPAVDAPPRSPSTRSSGSCWRVPGAIGVGHDRGRDRGRGRRCRRGPARGARPSARARGREPGPARGLRHGAARAARPQGRHARQGELRHPIGERGPVRSCGLLARRAARPRALGRPARAALRRARAALRLVGLGSRAPRPQLARPGGALLRDRRQARPEPARFARAAPRAPSDGGARSGRGRLARRRSPATVRPARTCSSRRRARARAWSPRSRSRRGHGCRPSSRRRLARGARRRRSPGRGIRPVTRTAAFGPGCRARRGPRLRRRHPGAGVRPGPPRPQSRAGARRGIRPARAPRRREHAHLEDARRVRRRRHGVLGRRPLLEERHRACTLPTGRPTASTPACARPWRPAPGSCSAAAASP